MNVILFVVLAFVKRHVMPRTAAAVAAQAMLLASGSVGLAAGSACSGYQNQCSLCVEETSMFGSCFYCEVDGSCHDFGSLSYPKGCSKSQCMSSSTFSSCSGTCGGDAGGDYVDGFNVPMAQCMAAVSNAAYQDESSDPLISAVLNDAGLTHYSVLSGRDTYGVVIASPTANAVIVGFRGTVVSDVNDVLADLDISLDDFASTFDSSYSAAAAGWKVGDGFSKAYLQLRDQMFDALTWAFTLLDSSPLLYVTGHSLGGSLAELATADIYLSGRVNDFSAVHLYTYAAPRTGNVAFAQGLAGLGPKVWSVQNYYDQIPHLVRVLFLWCGMVWYGVVWFGFSCCGVVWCAV